MGSFPFYKQLNSMDCGPACLRMVARHYGRHYRQESIRQAASFGKEGVSLLGISLAAENIGFRTYGVQLTYRQLANEAPLPCILHWEQNHFVVLVSRGRQLPPKGKQYVIADPAKGIVRYGEKELLGHWANQTTGSDDERAGSVLLLEPTKDFFAMPGEKENNLSWRIVLRYLRQSRWAIVQVVMAMVVTSLLSLAFPFLTQNIVDRGIRAKNLSYITIILMAQLMLIVSRAAVDFIRTRLLMRLSMVINMSILTDFWVKLTRLPIAYFDRHHTGDTMQRLGDSRQIQNFLTGRALNMAFSLFSFITYAVILAMYRFGIFLIFVAGSAGYYLWIRRFLSIRKKVNYDTFHFSAKENDATLQLVQGMPELKLHQAEDLKRREWESIQRVLFRLNFKSLNYSQIQQAGALLINQGKDVLITFLVARLVVESELTLGAMLAVQYILGQLSGPVEQFVSFTQNAQDARISMERLNDIHQLKEEEGAGSLYVNLIGADNSIRLRALSFSYPGPGNENILDDLTLEIPAGKVTAIVGGSGSGKTTLIRLLLKFHDCYSGDILIGDTNFNRLSPGYWRKRCGAVLQDGYIFNDTIAGNIALGEETVNEAKLIQCCRTANILSFIESLPNGFHTRLGVEGVGVSQGQKQRLMIARAIYRDPEYLFFDEATNALDATNERTIVENLNEFFLGRTVVIVAHRLSTVKNADKIIVLHRGKVAEEGTHEQLSLRRARYYQLVKNQLEIGN